MPTRKIVLLDEEGCYAGDYLLFEDAHDSKEEPPGRWTQDLPPDGLYRGCYRDSYEVGGGEFSGGGWVDLAAPSDAELAPGKVSREESVASLVIDALAKSIAVLQDAEDLGMADQAQSKTLITLRAASIEWRRYRVEVSRVPALPGYPSMIDWPVPPEIPAVAREILDSAP
ncbi:tail fiber assembly protein [Pseudomonas sp.]|uniref:tail fiber assembly protein n=1 Tax=Pseudomonas sp. TaxID=306 RepID=UPI00290D7BF9|nr:hypothetical protein [Pseudomonas sp.]MDU4250841.1 hypothetical protein [Pseudomonas sp.]